MYNSLVSWTNTTTKYIHYSLGEDETKRKRLTYASIGSLALISISCFIGYKRIQSKKQENKRLDAYFSDTYHSARSKFREAASQISIAKQHSIVIDSESDLSIDLCYIPGSNESKHVLLHFSGTHGVEGFAGSGIQVHLLQKQMNDIIHNTALGARPHLLFIHSLNPFGMAMNRRWNKANIDLNRNCILNETTWNEVLKREPNRCGYMDLDHFMNPQRKPTWFRDDVLFWFNSIFNILRYGYMNLKKIIVEGQYFKKDGLFYGGNKIAIEHDMLVQFLTQESIEDDKFGIDLCEIAEKVTLIDVHSGLGPYGIDSIFVNENGNMLRSLLPKYGEQICELGDNNMFDKMYRECEGNTHAKNGYCSLFVYSKENVSIVQEFGTFEGIHVFKALRAENMAYNYSQGQSMRDEKQFYLRGLDVKHVFYPQEDPLWKTKILNAGVYVFTQLLWR